MADPAESILQSYRDKSFGLTIAEENKLPTTSSRTPFCQLRIFDAGISPLDLNSCDQQILIMQVSLNYPAGTGDEAIKIKVKEIIDSYSFNDRLSGSGFFAVVDAKNYFNGVVEQGWYRVIIRINFLIYMDR